MTGATSPRLHLELLMARLLLPAVEDTRSGLRRPARPARARTARRRVRGGPRAGRRPAGSAAGAGPLPPHAERRLRRRPSVDRAARLLRSCPRAARTTRVPSRSPSDAVRRPLRRSRRPTPPRPACSGWLGRARRRRRSAGRRPAARDAADARRRATPRTPSAPTSAASEPPLTRRRAPPAAAPAARRRTAGPAAASATGPDTEVLRRRWPEVLETVKGLRRVTWALIDPRNAQVAELDATTLRVAFDNPRARHHVPQRSPRGRRRAGRAGDARVRRPRRGRSSRSR